MARAGDPLGAWHEEAPRANVDSVPTSTPLPLRAAAAAFMCRSVPDPASQATTDGIGACEAGTASGCHCPPTSCSSGRNRAL